MAPCTVARAGAATSPFIGSSWEAEASSPFLASSSSLRASRRFFILVFAFWLSRVLLFTFSLGAFSSWLRHFQLLKL